MKAYHTFKIILTVSFLAVTFILSAFDNIDDYVNDIREQFNIPGIALGVIVNDHILVSKGFGYRDLEKSLLVSEQTLFAIASCTKAFTAQLLFQLEMEGKLNLDDPVKKYIPEFHLYDAALAERITIRDLLAHRTGISRHDAIWAYGIHSKKDILNFLPYFPPLCELRTEFHYNNWMFIVAGIIAERVTGLSLDKAMTSRIFVPLEMDSTCFNPKKFSDVAHPYAYFNDSIHLVPFRDTSGINSTGGICSNVMDLFKWVHFQLTNSELHSIQMPFTEANILAQKNANADTETYSEGYGLGWFVGKYRGQNIVMHNGDLDGFCSGIYFLPKEKIGIIILTNSGSEGRDAIYCIRNLVLDQLLDLPKIDWKNRKQKEIEKRQHENSESVKQFNECKSNPIINIHSYIGSYSHPAYGTMEITKEKNGLIASFGNMKVSLHLKHDNQFLGELAALYAYGINPIVEFYFLNDESKNIKTLSVLFEKFYGADPIIFEKISN